MSLPGYLLQVLVAVQKEAYDPGGSSLLTCQKAALVEVSSGAGGNPVGAQSVRTAARGAGGSCRAPGSAAPGLRSRVPEPSCQAAPPPPGSSEEHKLEGFWCSCLGSGSLR